MVSTALFSFLALLPSFSLVLASPIAVDIALIERDEIIALSSVEISAFKPYTFFAAVAACQPSVTLAWSCGTKCDFNGRFEPTASGGDGGLTQFWYVGYDPLLDTVIVGHQGTDTDRIEAILVDAVFIPRELDKRLFPGLDSSIKVHNGFADSHARAAPDILSAVRTTLEAHPGASVTTTGHSLGGALALLSGVYLPLHLPSNTIIKTVTYGMPRVGNQAFANYVDANLGGGGGGFTRINNKRDPVPILPGRGLGFRHPTGEVHIEESNAWAACPGQENTDARCTIGTVPNIFRSNPDDHSGPFDGVLMGCT